jgi:predicted O-methyltransferase YrrM
MSKPAETDGIDHAAQALLAATATPLPAEIEAVLPDGRDEYEISPDLARLLAGIVLRCRPDSVLEFGSGRSSLVMARALGAAGGGRLTSVENAPAFGRDAWALTERVMGVDARQVVSKVRVMLTPGGPFNGYVEAAPALAARAPYDLVLIDGPSGPLGRDWTMFAAIRHLNPGALVIVDDTARPGERRAVERWLRRWPGLSVVLDQATRTRGATLLRFDGETRARFSLRTIAGAVYERARQAARQARGPLAAGPGRAGTPG